MIEVIERLIVDHGRFRRILDEIPKTLEEAVEGDETAKDRFFCMVSYLTGYPDEVHHPVEDLVFDRCRAVSDDDEALALLAHNIEQHARLKTLTEDLLALVDEEVDDWDLITTRALEYVAVQREHIMHEEAEVFPISERLLSNTTSPEELEHLLDQLHDPLFDAAEKRFAALFECLGIETDGIRQRGAAATARFLAATNS